MITTPTWFFFFFFFQGVIKQYSNKCLLEQHHTMTISAKQPQQQFTLKSKQQFKLKKPKLPHTINFQKANLPA